MKLVVGTFLTLCFFALNSLFCRWALQQESIDAASFAFFRSFSACVFLFVVLMGTGRKVRLLKTHNWNALALFVYLIGFSFAYVSLPSGTGALILFGSVQASMILAGLARGEKLKPRQFFGIFLAMAGLIYLLLPGLHSPNPFYGGLMAIAGVSWGIYSLLGRTSRAPIEETFSHFSKALLLCGFVLLIGSNHMHLSRTGLLYATLSGALASGLGYSIWYTVLPHLSRMKSSFLQLLVPIITAAGGFLFLSEPFTARLGISFIMTLSGIAIALL